MYVEQMILSGFLGFTLAILAIFQIKVIRDTIKEARDLSKALTTNQNLKGKFGEECLESILKVCYPEENVNYIKQFVTKNADGKEIKPDYLVKLPNEKSILIDCKLNIDKFLEYSKKPNSINKKEFIKDLNLTINNLANKKYETSVCITQPDFILMYIPLEAVVSMIYTDKDCMSVVKNANDKNIIIVGNSSILTSIRLVKELWVKETQNKNIENIIKLSQNLDEIITQHFSNLSDMKNVLENNIFKFNKEYEKIQASKLSLYAHELKNLGID